MTSTQLRFTTIRTFSAVKKAMPFNTCIHCESCGSSLTNSKHLASISELIISYSIHTSYTSMTLCYCIMIIFGPLKQGFHLHCNFPLFLIVFLSSSRYKRLKTRKLQQPFHPIPPTRCQHSAAKQLCRSSVHLPQRRRP